MTRAEFAASLETLAQAWADKDYEKAASFFAEDVHYGDPTRYGFASRADLLRFFQDDDGYPQRTVWHNVVFDEEKQLGAAEYSYEGTHRYHGLVLIKVSGDRFWRWREYQHVSPLEWDDYCAATAF